MSAHPSLLVLLSDGSCYCIALAGLLAGFLVWGDQNRCYRCSPLAYAVRQSFTKVVVMAQPRLVFRGNIQVFVGSSKLYPVERGQVVQYPVLQASFLQVFMKWIGCSRVVPMPVNVYEGASFLTWQVDLKESALKWKSRSPAVVLS